MGVIDATTETVSGRVDHSVPGVAGAILAAAALAVTAGPLGVAAGILFLGAWAVLPVPYALALGHLGLAALFSDGITLESLALVEAGFLLVLAGPLAGRGAGVRVAVAAVGVTVALLGVVAASLRSLDSILAAALVLVIAAAFLAYGLHRYELYRLGLVEP